MTKKTIAKVTERDKEKQTQRVRRISTLIQTAISDSHCGAGCTVGDIIAEFGVFAFGLSILGASLYAAYILDYVVAWTLGIVFQYFVIKPMIVRWPGSNCSDQSRHPIHHNISDWACMHGWALYFLFFSGVLIWSLPKPVSG